MVTYVKPTFKTQEEEKNGRENTYFPDFHYCEFKLLKHLTQPAFTCSNLTVETLEQGVKYVQINNKGTRTTPVVI